ncbi:MAG: L-carnitine dehydrogenase, partial [Acidimicrobiia bacterium]|nr:L-carnitine dehydrogenase [Acidimicrobiia bacterium]
MRFGVVGTGVIGAGWTTRALARGWDVVATDPAPAAEERLRLAVDRAWESARKLGVFPGADPTRLEFAASLEEVVSVSEFVQESVPEHESLKKGVHEAIDAVADPDVVVASSSSGLLPSHLQEGLRHPGRLVIGHPFNPVYLLPLVEVLGGSQTSETALGRAIAVYEDLGMYPLRVRTEIEGYLSDRLQEAMWREILHLVNDGVATTGELDEAILYGPG